MFALSIPHTNRYDEQLDRPNWVHKTPRLAYIYSPTKRGRHKLYKTDNFWGAQTSDEIKTAARAIFYTVMRYIST